MRLGHVEIFVRDPEASLAFYRDVLGCEVVAVQGGGQAWLKLGETEILLRRGEGAGEATARYQDAACALVLYADDLPRTLATLRARGLVLRGDDGPGCPTFTDPDGHWFQLVDPRDHGA